jgi:1,4-dihydroxy-6-naphthoate synthase
MPGRYRFREIPITAPCPNDTFIFHALVNERIDTSPFRFTPVIGDVEELNNSAFARTYPVTKLSFYAYLMLKEHYELLDAGTAVGYGCGPILVAKRLPESLEDAKIAVPGPHTTAYLLFRLWHGPCKNIIFTRFDEILPGISSGKYDAGLIIHEGRFVYPSYGCVEICDLGKWWESETGLPIPLGCIAIRRDMMSHKDAVEALIRKSIGYAMENPKDAESFIEEHAQEMDKEVIYNHIALYVNNFSLSLGTTGMEAVHTLSERAHNLGLL